MKKMAKDALATALKKTNEDLATLRRDADAAGKKAKDEKAVRPSELPLTRTDEQTTVEQSTRLEHERSDVQQLFEDEQKVKDALAMALQKANDDLVTFQRDGDTAGRKLQTTKRFFVRSSGADEQTVVAQSTSLEQPLSDV